MAPLNIPSKESDMNTPSYLLILPRRQKLAKRVNRFYRTGENHAKIRTVTQTLGRIKFPPHEELALWKMVSKDLKSLPQTEEIGDFLYQVNHAIESLRKPKQFRNSKDFDSLMRDLKK